jgi:type IV pilus assembly protein PilB
LLRQDPNIIMVGEIRDKETAELAVQAALTGHVVLSTLHTNNAATTLPRLLEMAVEPFLIASTVNTVVGQRLVRQVCTTCRIPYVPEGQELADLARDFQIEAALEYFEKTKVQAAVAAPVAQAAPGGHGKTIKPPGNSTDKSILEKIKSDPNIINRSAEEAKKQPVSQAPPTTTVSPVQNSVDPSKLKKGQFLLYKAGDGCGGCSSGYRGRMGIYEVLDVSETIGKLIVSHATSEEIQTQAISEGMLTMQQDGFVKVLRGLTTVAEILRVTRE